LEHHWDHHLGVTRCLSVEVIVSMAEGEVEQEYVPFSAMSAQQAAMVIL
jgi:hypothetical protein